MKNHTPTYIAVRATALAVLLACVWSNQAMALPPSGVIVYNYIYDNNDNLTQSSDALGHITNIGYDGLNRRASVTDPATGVTVYGYDALDHLISVTDPRSLVTGYQIDGLDNLNQLQSPDTGTTANAYDAAGNLTSRTDAKQQTTHYSYDALNRLTSITYADSSTVTYTYDQGTNAIGRLSQIGDASGSIQYSYDIGGRILGEARVINVLASVGGSAAPTIFNTGYAYDSAGRLASVTYPSGRVISYGRDGDGRISQITSVWNNITTVLVSQVQYQPFGGIKSYVNSAGTFVARSYDTYGRIVSYTLNGIMHTISYDGASNIVATTDGGNPGNNTSYAYDALDRLTSALSSINNLGYGYDANGNRTSSSAGSSGNSYTIAATSNQLQQISAAQTLAYSTDANGSITNNGINQYVYDARGRMSGAVTAAGNVQYTINALGQRVQKIGPMGSTVFEYDITGKLIGEVDSAGGVTSQRDYIYLGDLPVAVIQM